MPLDNKNIIIGISGSIAAYKSCEIIRLLIKEKATVIPVMTKNAAEFITPLTIQTLSKNRVYVNMFESNFDWEIEHISIAKKSDLFLIAPATANVIAKIATGIADDSLTTLVLSVRCPVVICPAMNSEMYKNPVTQKNISYLKKIGYYFIGPEKGELACGEEGDGRLANPEKIIAAVKAALAR
ncbi:MAG TPA: bifunctional phosphopantothenoylcysteine decarboxylase/phosphopantothenate--cysteine ligase CoaBC [Elusimicrobia bacterium]|nr:bifunctional phosphopantothenoylcysteine decarboxylase/phosphopantothenate--cysteine ligase CoaBC [Elusimicrobiota bacterium]